MPATTPFQGLAPFLRMSIRGGDLRSTVQTLLTQANATPEDAVLLMNLATGFLALEMNDLGLTLQAQALEQQRLYTRPATSEPPALRLLMLMAPGDLAENTPLDCLLENSPVELTFYYATPEAPLPDPLPEHDALLVAMSDSPANLPVLMTLALRLAAWHRPVINRPELIPNVDRQRLSDLLQDIPGVVMPHTQRMPRATLLENSPAIPSYPLIIRPVGSHAGHDLARIADADELAAYLAAVNVTEYFVAPFVDYSGADGLFRKCRVALLNGAPFACHMAVSSHWMVHYVNAGMYDAAEKRAEEARFMVDFAVQTGFAARHATALGEIHRRLKLDYVCLDCAELSNGELLIFEIDHNMVVHAMDDPELFPFKQTAIGKLQQAFEDYLRGRVHAWDVQYRG